MDRKRTTQLEATSAQPWQETKTKLMNQVPRRYQSEKRSYSERPKTTNPQDRPGDCDGNTARGSTRLSVLLVYADYKSRFLIALILVHATAHAMRLETRSVRKGN